VPVTPSFRTLALEQLGRATPAIRAKAMFGGVGVYSNEYFFALLDDDILYLKADDVTRAQFESNGMAPFKPFGDDGESMSYYAVAGDVLEDLDALQSWVDLAIDAAKRKRKRPGRGGRD